MDPANVIAIVVGLTGLSGCVFTALKWRREDTASLVQSQSTVVHDMQAINVELRTALEDCKRGRRAG